MTHETKHTPQVGHTAGPWHVEPEEWTDGRGIAICCADGAVAIIDAEIAPNDEDYANARLIAAAPELLEALKTAYVLLNQIRDDGYAGEYLPELDWALQGDETGDSTILTAIAKAEGKV